MTIIQSHVQNAAQFRVNSNLIGNIVAVAVQIWPQQIARVRFAWIILAHTNYFAAFEGEGEVAVADCGGDFKNALLFQNTPFRVDTKRKPY